ncbi:MAG TPA: YqjK-like family protein [Methylotenera sp.]|nr:YqjK-like family protein [Methylotenera sp.]HPV44723.1 YqjK-like family protein [Methylotenera sp.]
MNKKLLKLAQRRERLVSEAETQRMKLVQTVDTLRPALAMADKGLAAIRYIKAHPLLMAGSGAVLMKVLRPSRIGKWFGRGLFAWQMVRKLQNKFL